MSDKDGSPLPEGVEWPRVDGKPVVPGDVLWDGDGKRVTVDTVQCTVDRYGSTHCLSAFYESGTVSPFYKTDGYTRTEPTKPVLDRDGVPIEVGDTVYVAGSGGLPCEVVDPRSEQLGGSVKVVSPGTMDGSGPKSVFTWFRPGGLTHERPESWERLEEDAAKGASEYWDCIGVECEFCPATVDGKTPAERYDVAYCTRAQFVDIVRRAKALAGVVGDE